MNWSGAATAGEAFSGADPSSLDPLADRTGGRRCVHICLRGSSTET